MAGVIGWNLLTVIVLVREYENNPVLRRATQVIVKLEVGGGTTVIVAVPFPEVMVPPEDMVQVMNWHHRQLPCTSMAQYSSPVWILAH